MNLQAILKPGDLLIPRGSGWTGNLIRLGAALAGKPNISGHVAVFHHYDPAGVPMGLEGKPGGVGWVDMRSYLNDPWTMNNVHQPGRADQQRVAFGLDAAGMLGTPYDWLGILGDGFDDLNLKLWNLPGFKVKPGAVVCSSFAAYLYAKLGWAHPDLGTERYCQPDDWTQFVIANRYNVSLLAGS